MSHVYNVKYVGLYTKVVIVVTLLLTGEDVMYQYIMYSVPMSELASLHLLYSYGEQDCIMNKITLTAMLVLL